MKRRLILMVIRLHRKVGALRQEIAHLERQNEILWSELRDRGDR